MEDHGVENPGMENPSNDDIRIRAHQLWEQAGQPDGRDAEFWHQAEQELSQAQAHAPAATEPPATVFPG